jgi:putative membrane protein
MARFLMHWIIIAIALGAAAYVVPGIHIDSGPVLIIAALALGLVNAVVRPVLTLLTLPLTIVTLGLFYLVVNAAAFGMAAALVRGFRVDSLGSAILGSLVVAFVSSVFSWLIRKTAEDGELRRG